MYPLFQNKNILAFLAIILLVALNFDIIKSGIDSDFFGIFFSIILFLVGGRKTNFKVNYLLIGIILILEFVAYRLHTKSLHFLAIAMFICLIYYGFTKKFSFIAFICILLFSTVFNKFFEHLTAEIKQALCENVYLLLKNFIKIDKIEGVNFYINGAKISIDTACMGLSMFKTGLLTGAILLTLEERKQKLYFSIFQIIIFSVVVILLNIISNYFRIITLILLNCTEENVLHHTIGLLCFLLYQVVPMLILIRYFKPKKQEIDNESFKIKSLQILSVLAILVITSCELKNSQNHNLLENINPKYNLKQGKWVTEEVFKIETPGKLIYIKTAVHKPLICWTGSGYKITESREIMLNGEKIWFNSMEKNNLKYKSLWWYECGDKKYTSFIQVMFLKLLYNEPIRLINETSEINEPS